jgi:hypothetical protein
MAFTEELRAEQDIAAAPDRVWEVLTEFDKFGEWNPFIVSIEGEPAVGAKLTVRLEPPGGRGATLHPVVTTSAPGQAFGWRGRLVARGVFDAEHRFELESPPQGGTHLVHSEHFSGVLVPLFRRSLRRHTLAGFEAMNRALQARAENR